jgi:hypothetical protein
MSLFKLPITFLGGLLLGLWIRWFFTSLVAEVCPPDCWEKWSCQDHWQGGTHPLGESGWGSQTHNGIQWGAGSSEGSTACQTDKNLGSNSDLPQEAKEELDQLPVRHPSNHLLMWNHDSQVQAVGWKYCAVWVCEIASLRCSLAAKWGRNPNLLVHGEFVWSRVSPNRASSLGFIWTHYN